jgi:hypothetical protein
LRIDDTAIEMRLRADLGGKGKRQKAKGKKESAKGVDLRRVTSDHKSSPALSRRSGVLRTSVKDVPAAGGLLTCGSARGVRVFPSPSDSDG